jgi:hypothetical protein
MNSLSNIFSAFLFELEKTGRNNPKENPTTAGDWVFWLSMDFKGPKRYRAGENRWF